MELSTLFVSQRKLRAPGAVAALMACVRGGDLLPPILLSEDDDGSVQIEDGHHRATAFWLCGCTRLEPHEYLLLPRTRRRPRFGRIADLVARVRAGGGLEGLRAVAGRGRDPPRRSIGGRGVVSDRRHVLEDMSLHARRGRPGRSACPSPARARPIASRPDGFGRRRGIVGEAVDGDADAGIQAHAEADAGPRAPTARRPTCWRRRRSDLRRAATSCHRCGRRGREQERAGWGGGGRSA
jgi:hypothetical protein